MERQKTTFFERCEIERERLGLSEEAMGGALLGKEEATPAAKKSKYRNHMNRGSTPRVDEIERLATMLDISPAWLAFDMGPKDIIDNEETAILTEVVKIPRHKRAALLTALQIVASEASVAPAQHAIRLAPAPLKAEVLEEVRQTLQELTQALRADSASLPVLMRLSNMLSPLFGVSKKAERKAQNIPEPQHKMQLNVATLPEVL